VKKKEKYQVAWNAWDSGQQFFECEANDASHAIKKSRSYIQESLGYERAGYSIREVYLI
jgi:hypothetical protein